MRTCVIGAGFGFLLAGCGFVTPPPQYDNVEISEIVQRIKCELAFSVPDVRGQYPTGDFQWMRYWTAKVDLTLITNDNGSITPSATFIYPLSQQTLANVGTFSRQVSVGAGAGLSGTASRNEVLSFTLSMNELMESRRNTDCELPKQLGLMGNLGLQEWVSSALAPARNKQLTIGYHAPPTGKSVALPGPAGLVAAGAPTAQGLLAMAEDALREAEGAADQTRSYADAARQFALKKQIQATYNAVDKAYGNAENATNKLEEALNFAWQASRVDRDSASKLSPAERDRANKTISENAKVAADRVAKATQTAKAAWELLPRDSPIDSISHQVQFTVATSANVKPNWTLVHFQGPSNNGNLASVSRTNLNTLSLVLGAPADPGSKALSDEQRRQLLFQRLQTLPLLVVPQ